MKNQDNFYFQEAILQSLDKPCEKNPVVYLSFSSWFMNLVHRGSIMTCSGIDCPLHRPGGHMGAESQPVPISRAMPLARHNTRGRESLCDFHEGIMCSGF